MSSLPSIDDIKSNFEFLDAWEDRYRYIIQLGRELPPFPEHLRLEDNKVRGCASQVWLVADIQSGPDGPILHYQADSDAHIVRGLVAIVLALYSGQSAQDILKIDANGVMKELGLADHLTSQRTNGLASMIAKIRKDAGQAVLQ